MHEIINTQKGTNNTQIGEQNNCTENNNTEVHVETHYNTYIGASLEEVTTIVTNLFLDNFPRMQKVAKDAAEARINELWENIVKELPRKDVKNLLPFMEVDVQYVLYEAQKGYARFATKDLLSNLSSLIIERVKHNEDDLCLRVAIDKAISVVPMLSQEHLDYLSLMFISKFVKVPGIENIQKLKELLDYLDDTFFYSSDPIVHLNNLGCLQLALGDSWEILSNAYGINQMEIKEICPDKIKKLHSDYNTSYVGTILAIVNAERKTKYRFNPKIWIHD